jgi:peroxiredoxin
MAADSQNSGGTAVHGDSTMTGLHFGQPAPDFTLPSTAGADITLSALRGQDVVLVFYCFDWGSI